MEHIKKQIDTLLSYNIYGSLTSMDLSKSKYAYYLTSRNSISDKEKEKLAKITDADLYYISSKKVMLTSNKPEDIRNSIQERMLIIMNKLAKQQVASLETKQELVAALQQLRELQNGT